MKIGIPRALLYYDYYPLWETFFTSLGAEIILSEKTTKDILVSGAKQSVNDACLPLKVFHGHVINLIGKCDYIFIPRLKSVAKGEYICPKFCGLPDMIKYSVENIPPIIDTEINVRKDAHNLLRAFYETGSFLTNDKKKIKTASQKALLENTLFIEKMEKGFFPSDILENRGKEQNNFNNLNVAVLGHVYNVYDEYVNMNLFEKLNKNYIKVITTENIGANITDSYALKAPKKLFWTFARKILGAAMYLADNDVVDGVVYIMSFGCGIDSFIADLCERYFKNVGNMPFYLMVIDEHSGENGMETRLEAFIDMIRRKKDKAEAQI